MSDILGHLFKRYKNKKTLSSKNGYLKVCITVDKVSYMIHGMTKTMLTSVDPDDLDEAFREFVASEPAKKSIAFTRLVVNYTLRKYLSARFSAVVVEKISHFYECNFKHIHNWSDYRDAISLYSSLEVVWKPRNGRINTYIHDDISIPLEKVTIINAFDMWGIMDHITVNNNFKLVLHTTDCVIVNLLQLNELSKYFHGKDTVTADTVFEALD